MKLSDRVAIGTELIDRNICEWIDLDRVYKVGGTPILNGLFGVEKPSKLADGRAILRLIMNLTGSNSTQEQLEGTTSSLPSITSWQSIFLEGDESLALHQSDMSSAFYLFRLPRVWLPYLAFAVVVSGADIDRDPRKKYALACKVLPMGWLSSVGIMQEISENILKRKDLSALGQVAKMKPLPHWFNEILETAKSDDKSWWHVYLDNFACGERIFLARTFDSALSLRFLHLHPQRRHSQEVLLWEQVEEVSEEVVDDLNAPLRMQWLPQGPQSHQPGQSQL